MNGKKKTFKLSNSILEDIIWGPRYNSNLLKRKMIAIKLQHIYLYISYNIVKMIYSVHQD